MYTPGSAVYDALKLSVPTNVTETELKAIIKYYFPGSTVESAADAANAASTNPFLMSVITADGYAKKLKGSALGSAQSAQSVLSDLSMSSIGGLDVTTITDGLAKFLVKRAKDELSAAFFTEKLKTALLMASRTPDRPFPKDPLIYWLRWATRVMTTRNTSKI